jgi:hypothetical protein
MEVKHEYDIIESVRKLRELKYKDQISNDLVKLKDDNRKVESAEQFYSDLKKS